MFYSALVATVLLHAWYCEWLLLSCLQAQESTLNNILSPALMQICGMLFARGKSRVLNCMSNSNSDTCINKQC